MSSLRQRQPREHNDSHLAFIRTLPCLVCKDPISTEAAHIRYSDPSVAKINAGIGAKPDDRFTVPLCGEHHRQQHAWSNEREWWGFQEIDPIKKALALYSVSGDFERGNQIVTGV